MFYTKKALKALLVNSGRHCKKVTHVFSLSYQDLRKECELKNYKDGHMDQLQDKLNKLQRVLNNKKDDNEKLKNSSAARPSIEEAPLQRSQAQQGAGKKGAF